MKKTKYLLILLSFLVIYSCGDDDDLPEPFDHAGQSVIDEDILQKFLKTHYYIPAGTVGVEGVDEHFGKIDSIENGETPLFDIVSSEEVNYADVSYTVYYLQNEVGVGESPALIDSTLVNYKGSLLYVNADKEEEDKIFDQNKHYTYWANLYSGVIPGWTYLMPNFNAGVNTSIVDAPLSFDQTGKGFILMPSGLGYRNSGSPNIPASSPLIFHVEMAMIKRNDQDRDGIHSMYEDLDNDNKFDDDTDGDKISNFIDFDDDGDGILTRFENADANNDGNPNDALDTNTDTVPNYLDSDDDGDGVLTIDEGADPNKDGDPSDAKDTDNDGIPDYLDNN